MSVSGGSLRGLRGGTEAECVVKPFAIEGPHVRVEQPWRHATIENRLPLRGGGDRDVTHGLDRDTGGVRSGDDVVQVQQRVVRPRRLVVEYIQTCAGDAAADKRLQQRPFVVYRSARSGNKVSGGFHRRELALADEAFGFGGKGARHLDVIRE